MTTFKIIGMGKFGTALYNCISKKGGGFSETDYNWLIPAVPSSAVREVIEVELSKTSHSQIKILLVSKGMSENKFLTEILEEIILNSSSYLCPSALSTSRLLEYCLLIGPHLADELGAGLPTRSTLASIKYSHFEELRQYFPNCTFSDNPHLMSLASVFKNIVAFVCGIAEGLELGYNAKACIVQESVFQLLQIAVELGFIAADNYLGESKKSCLADLLQPGILGDLILTCTSGKSRNFQAGKALVEGRQTDFLVESAHSAAILLNRLKSINSNNKNFSIIEIAAKSNSRSLDELREGITSMIVAK